MSCGRIASPSFSHRFPPEMCGRTWIGVRKMLINPPCIGGHRVQPSIQSVRLLQTLSTVTCKTRCPPLFSGSDHLSSSPFSRTLTVSFYSTNDTKVQILSTKETCPICLESLKSVVGGDEEGIFTGECSHSCHTSCISKIAKDGNHRCPICRRKWKNIPSFSGHEKVTIKTFTEFPAVAASRSVSSFSVLLSMNAPPLPVDSENQRVPVDLVAVLDVSSSMAYDSKIYLLKSAANFIIDHMMPFDRLSLVAFSSTPQIILPLCKMTEKGRQDAKSAVKFLHAGGFTDIVGGLNMGAQVLEGRHKCESNPVSSIIFLSDGDDTVNQDCNPGQPRYPGEAPPGYLKLLSPSIFAGNRDTYKGNARHPESFPIHTFGVGEDHDPVVMNAIADGSSGTFSFLESAKMIPTSFARCIGGLFSVVAQHVRLMVTSGSPGVKIKRIPSGRHESEIDSKGKQGVIHVGDLYAEEKKEFLVQVSIPKHSENTQGNTNLLEIACSYHDALSMESVQLEGERVELPRPTILSPADIMVSVEVDRQKNRVAVTESIAKAKEMAEKNDLEGAKKILDKCKATLLDSASGQAGDDLVNSLESELVEIAARMSSRSSYESFGRAYTLSAMSSHSSQRAGSRMNRVNGSGEFVAADLGEDRQCYSYGTPTMQRFCYEANQEYDTADSSSDSE